MKIHEDTEAATADTAEIKSETAHSGTQSHKKKHWRLLSSLLMITLIAVTMIVIFHDTSISDIWTNVKSVNPVWLSFAMAASLLSIVMLGVALHISLCTLHNKRVSFLRSVGFAFLGQYYSSITPSASGGQPMQLYYMCAYGVDISYASLSLLLVNIAYQLIVLLVPAALFPFRAGLVLANIGPFRWFLLFGVFVSLTLILFLGFAVFSKTFVGRAADWIIRLLAKIRIVKDTKKSHMRVDVYVQRYRHGARVFRRHPLLFAGELAVYIVQMCLQFIIPYFIYRAFGLHEYGVIDFLALQSVLYIAVCFLPLPGAAGASESAFLSIFRVVFQSGLVVSAMLLSRLVSFYVILLISGAVSLAMQIVLSRRRALPAGTNSDTQDVVTIDPGND
jgi:uncharacterized protein (TIRG00374 family)